MFRWITIFALAAIVFTATGLHKLGGDARAATPVQVIELSQSGEAQCCKDAKEQKHNSCVSPYIAAATEGHFLNNKQNAVFVFHDDSVQTGAPASPLKRPPRPVL